MPKTYKPPIDKEKFENRTALLVELIAETVLEQKGVPSSLHMALPQTEWFIQHCDLRVRWLYANNAEWTKVINSKRDGGNYKRDYVYMFVGHWADSFLKDPEKYIRRHPTDVLDASSQPSTR